MDMKHYKDGDILVLELKGELENKTMHRMKPFIVKVVNEDCKKIVLDMDGVRAVDKSWCDYLVKMLKVMEAYGRKLVIARCPQELSKEAFTKQVTSLYSLFASLDEAMTHFGSRGRSGITAPSAEKKEDS